VKIWGTIKRVLSTYSIEEKVISIIAGVLLVVFGIQWFSGVFQHSYFLPGEGGLYIEGILTDKPVLINPIYADFSDADRDISTLVFSGLTKYDPEKEAFVADLANLTISEDKKIYRFEMKDGIFWHDGEKLTVDDVYFTFHDVVQDPEMQNPVLKANFEGVEIKKIDEKNIEFVLQNPNSFFITNLNVGILPQHILGEMSLEEVLQSDFNFNPIGTGPYKMDGPLIAETDGIQRVSLKINESYYGELPKIEKIRFYIYPYLDFLVKEKNNINIIAKVPADLSEELQKSERFSFKSYELPQYTAVFMNMDSPVLQKDKVRLALQKAIDKEELMKLFKNKMRIDTPLLQLDQEDWIYKPNKEEAAGALFDSGYKMGDDVNDPYRKKSEGENLKLVMLVREYGEGTVIADENKALVDFLVNAWKEIGIEIEVNKEPVEVFNERIRSRDYDLVLTGQSLGYNLDTYSFWHSSQSNEAGLNLSNYRSFAADSLIERIRNTFDKEKKDALLEELAKAISKDIPAVFLYRPSYLFATDGKVKGIKLSGLAFPSDRFVNVSDWCIFCEP
jgi:peptide/nickel transport system substrate-binding protein